MLSGGKAHAVGLNACMPAREDLPGPQSISPRRRSQYSRMEKPDCSVTSLPKKAGGSKAIAASLVGNSTSAYQNAGGRSRSTQLHSSLSPPGSWYTR